MLQLGFGLLLALAAGTASAAAPLPQEARIAFFGITWIDTSTEGDVFGERAEEQARVARAEAQVTERFAEEGYDFVDTAPVEDRLAGTVNPANCYGCDMRMAAELDAGYALVGEVQKVSNLIIDMNLQLREVPSGRLIAGRSVSIRGNTDESWSRGIRYILDNAIFTDEPAP
jgi:hypothetical protein